MSTGETGATRTVPDGLGSGADAHVVVLQDVGAVARPPVDRRAQLVEPAERRRDLAGLGGGGGFVGGRAFDQPGRVGADEDRRVPGGFEGYGVRLLGEQQALAGWPATSSSGSAGCA